MLLVILCDILLFIAGLLIGKFFFSNKSKAEKDLAEAKNELGELRNKMRVHLSETAFLFQQFDDQYNKLLKHFGDISKDMSSSLLKENTNDPKTITTVKTISDLQNVKSANNKNVPIQPKDYEV